MVALKGFYIVKEIVEEKKSAGGLILPESEKPKICRYEVISASFNENNVNNNDIVYIPAVDVITSSNFEPGIGIVKAEKVMAKE